jgi:type I restriction enzyme, S subunit
MDEGSGARMSVRLGYKQTELGEIPVDWQFHRVDELVNYINGKAHEKNISHFGKFVVVNSKFISTEGETRKYSDEGLCIAKNNDVLMVMSDVPNGRAIAKCFFVEDNEKYTVNQRICILNPVSVSGKLLYYKLNRNKYYLAFDDGAKQTNLRKEDVLSCQIALPETFDEQEKIAEALSDVDALLAKLDQLIAKKRDLKQAAMQQLLTGQTRLPGFSGEWEVKRLDALADIRSGGTPSTTQPAFWNGDVLWCTPTDITALAGSKYLSQTTRMITNIGLQSSSAELIPSGSIVMTSRATIGECAINEVPVTTNQGFKNFIPYSCTDGEFLYYLLQTKKQNFIGLCSGSTFLEIGKAQLVSFELEVPSKTEQIAVAKVLSEMDSELATLETRRDKTQSLKQGMMQELLTGRIRLV